MTKVFLERVEAFNKQIHQQQSDGIQSKKKHKRTLSMVMIQMWTYQLQKYDNVYFQHSTLENFANFHKDPNIAQCWDEIEWQQWHKELILLRQQLPQMEGIALAAWKDTQ